MIGNCSFKRSSSIVLLHLPTKQFLCFNHSAVPLVRSLYPSAFLPAHESSIPKSLAGLKSSTAASPDRVEPVFLQICQREISLLVTTLLDHSLGECTFPSEWRDVAITPIPKPANCSAGPLENRPIANSSVWLKVIEKHLLSKLDDTLKAADDPFQLAYKSNRSTLDVIAHTPLVTLCRSESREGSFLGLLLSFQHHLTLPHPFSTM